MIYVISGEDIVASRNKLNELLSGKGNIIRLDGKKNSIAELDEALVSESLFSDTKTVVLERFSKLKPEAGVWDLLGQFEKDKSTDIILWDEVDISKKKFAKGVQVFNFLFPKLYYQFLDSFQPNSKRSLELFHEVLKTFEPEQVLYGLVRRIRQLLIIKSNNYSKFSEFKRMQPWQVSKLKKQAALWTEEQLKKVFLELAELDEKLKTSNLPMPLAHHLDILLLSDIN
jgi:DNA polymerase III delta subunit